MYNIGICDDGENICTAIENMLLQYAAKKGIQVDTIAWYTGEGLKRYLEQGNPLDILFLDIELLRMSGIEIGDYIRNQLDNLGLQIIYISAKSSYAQSLFRTQPLDFLVKPIEQRDIDDVLDRAIKLLKRKREKFEFQRGGEYYYLAMGDIMYLCSKGRKIEVVTKDETYEFYGKLKDIEKNMQDTFLMIHHSYIINREYIFRYTYETIELINGTVLSISEARRKQVRESLMREN